MLTLNNDQLVRACSELQRVEADLQALLFDENDPAAERRLLERTRYHVTQMRIWFRMHVPVDRQLECGAVPMNIAPPQRC